MKTPLFITILLLSLILDAHSQAQPVEPHEPAITLFDSVDTVREFMNKKTQYDYSDQNLIEVSLRWMDEHPRKGEAWVYRFAHRIPTRGTYLSIFHFTDGEIIEFQYGP